jgi:hypothetical protein
MKHKRPSATQILRAAIIVKTEGQGQNVKFKVLIKGLNTRNTHTKYESPILSLKDVGNAKYLKSR